MDRPRARANDAYSLGSCDRIRAILNSEFHYSTILRILHRSKESRDKPQKENIGRGYVIPSARDGILGEMRVYPAPAWSEEKGKKNTGSRNLQRDTKKRSDRIALTCQTACDQVIGVISNVETFYGTIALFRHFSLGRA